MENLAGLGIALAAMLSDDDAADRYRGYPMLSALPDAPTVDRASFIERLIDSVVRVVRSNLVLRRAMRAAGRRRRVATSASDASNSRASTTAPHAGACEAVPLSAVRRCGDAARAPLHP